MGSLVTRGRLCTPKLGGSCPSPVSVDSLATARCKAYSQLLPLLLHEEGRGKQVRHQPTKGSWLSCAVFCQTNKGAWYSPRRELAAYHLDSHLPEGTLCHHDGSIPYYCQDNLCLPADPGVGDRSLVVEGEIQDTDIIILDNEGFVVTTVEGEQGLDGEQEGTEYEDEEDELDEEEEEDELEEDDGEEEQ